MKLLNTKQVANHFGVSVMTVTRWVKSNKIKSVRTPGGRYRFTVEEINRVCKLLSYPPYKGSNYVKQKP